MRAGLLLLVSVAACRSTPSVAVADPTPAVTAPQPAVTAKVVTNRVEIARTGHPPIVLELPVVESVEGVANAARVNAHLSPEKILGQSIDDVTQDAKQAKAGDGPFGVQGTTYQVPYHAHDLLEVEAFTEFMGAYPSTQRFHVLIDLRTGDAIGADAFVTSRVPALVKRLEARREAEARAAVAKEPTLADFVRDVHFEAKDLADFSPRPDGITFHFDYGFPHVARAIQPPGRYFLSWAELADDIKPSSPLARAKP